MGTGRWALKSSRPLPALNPIDAWRRTPDTGLRVTWLGHSTTLIEIDGMRVLTDPVWGLRASPLSLAGPKRFQPVPVALREMPPVDVVIISHDHYDHLDYPTIRALAKSDVPFVTSLGVGAHLEAWGIAPARITELDWWESYDLPTGGVQVRAAPSQHFSGRTPKTRNATLWSSFVVRSERHCVFFSGDTGLTTEYRDIRARLVMPKRGEPVEPGRVSGAVEPWWRSVDRVVVAELPVASESTESTLAQTVPWPID